MINMNKQVRSINLHKKQTWFGVKRKTKLVLLTILLQSTRENLKEIFRINKAVIKIEKQGKYN